MIRAALSVYRRARLDPILWPRNAGSYPGYVFTGEPLKLPTSHFGLGHGGGAHAPDEYMRPEGCSCAKIPERCFPLTIKAKAVPRSL